MADRKEINPFDLFKMENEDSVSITSVDDSGIPYIEDVTKLDKKDDETDNKVDDKNTDNKDDKNVIDDNIKKDTDSNVIKDDIVKDDKDPIKDNDDSEETGLFSSFADTLVENGVLIHLEDKEYEESENGLIEMVEDTVEFRIDEYKKSKPKIVQDLIEFVDNGGDPRRFIEDLSSKVDYKEVDVTDEDNQKNLIREHLASQELEDAEIEELISSYEESNALLKHAKLAQNVLVKQQEKEYQKQLEDQKAFKLQEEERIKKQDKEFKDNILSRKKFGDYEANEKEKKDFLDFLTKPVKKDASGRLLTKYEVELEDLDKRLEQAFYQFKGGIKEIEKRVERKKTINFKNTLSRYQDKNASQVSTSNEDTKTKVATDKKAKVDLSGVYKWM